MAANLSWATHALAVYGGFSFGLSLILLLLLSFYLALYLGIFDEAFREAILATYERLTSEAAQRGADLIVWPETAIPFLLRWEPKGGARIAQLAAETKRFLLVGGPQLEGDRYYNSAFLISRNSLEGLLATSARARNPRSSDSLRRGSASRSATRSTSPPRSGAWF